MKKEKTSGDLKELLQERGNLCISIIIPLQEKPSDKKINTNVIAHAYDKVEKLLEGYKDPRIQEILNTAIQMQKKIDLSKGLSGVGIFISPNLTKLIEFTFPVKEKIMSGNSFEVRDVFYKEFLLKDYYILSLSMKKVKLFKASGTSATEVKDKTFPAEFKDTYEYSKPSRGSSYGNSLKEFERDKSVIQGKRIEAFFRELDLHLDKYLKKDIPLVLAGTQKTVGYFEKTTSHTDNIIGKLYGNYTGYAESNLSKAAWEKMKEYIGKEQTKAVRYVKEHATDGLIATGVQRVWSDARIGKGRTLVVEKDFLKPAFIGKRANRLLLRPPQEAHRKIPDIVDDIVETVIEKQGKVILVENRRLKEFEGIALINRY